MTQVHSANQQHYSYPLLTIGFCTDLAAEERLCALGIERIWRRGNGIESLEDALYDFRERTGVLAFVNDTRIFGETNDAISDAFDEMERLGVKPVDIDDPWLRVPKLQDRARKALHAAAPMPSHRVARRRGRMGGLARAEAARIARATRCAEDIAMRICNHPKLTWADRLFILGDGFTRSSIERHYKT